LPNIRRRAELGAARRVVGIRLPGDAGCDELDGDGA
jgi:hypothetical protein